MKAQTGQPGVPVVDGVYGFFDYIVGSDLVYNEIGSCDLPRRIKDLVSSHYGSFMLYAHTFHRYDHLDKEFLENLDKIGLEVFELDPKTGAPNPVSEEFFAELFPEKRIALLYIAMKGSLEQR